MPEPMGVAAVGDVLLEKIMMRADTRISRDVLKTMRLEAWADDMVDGLTYSLTGYMLGEHISQQTFKLKYQVPASWWQMFKGDSRLVPAWFTNRWPVRYEVREAVGRFDALAAFPAHQIKTPPELRGPIVVPYYRESA